MTALAWLIPAALVLGGLGLAAFLWTLKSNQYEDLEGAAWRALDDDVPQRSANTGDVNGSDRTPEPRARDDVAVTGAKRD